MKTERKGIITISENGNVSVPVNVQMRDFEIAELLGVMVPTVKSNIQGVTLVGNNLLPDYFGLDMVMALVFRIHSWQAEIFRQWILKKVIDKECDISHQIFISVNSRRNKTLN